MFYQQLMKLCKERNIKPTPLAKSLGISPGNMRRWENGATVNSDILARLSEYFEVPVDYFFNDNEADAKMAITDDGNSIKKVYHVLTAHPDHIASMSSGMSVSATNISKIASYLNCSVEYLVLDNMTFDKQNPTEDTTQAVIPTKDLILNMLAKLAGNPEYRYLQVKISSIIISNLAKKNITMDKLLDIKLSAKKVKDLYDLSLPAEKKKGLNFSDLIRISEAFNISYEFMLTGNGN